MTALQQMICNEPGKMPLNLQAETPVALICAVMAPGQEAVLQACRDLEPIFGELSDRSDLYDFDPFSTYYAPEMGTGLSKCVARYGDPVLPSNLASAKLDTLRLEQRAAIGDDAVLARTINLDPGLLSPHSLVLATTKASGHRITIAPSLYAEVTLLYEKGEYRPLPWSYRDYQSPAVQDFLLRQRPSLI